MPHLRPAGPGLTFQQGPIVDRIEPDQGQRVGLRGLHPAGLKGLRRQRQEMGVLLGQSLGLGAVLAPKRPLQIPADQAEVVREEKMTLEPQERVGQLPIPSPHDPRDGDLRVVVADPPRHPAEEHKRTPMPLQKCLRALTRKHAQEDRVGVRQGHHE